MGASMGNPSRQNDRREPATGNVFTGQACSTASTPAAASHQQQFCISMLASCSCSQDCVQRCTCGLACSREARPVRNDLPLRATNWA